MRRVDAKGRDLLKASEPKEFAEFARTIRPRGEQVFFGAYDPDGTPAGLAERVMNRFMRLVPEARQALPAGDFRDWPAIEAWAQGIGHQLGSDDLAVAHPTPYGLHPPGGSMTSGTPGRADRPVRSDATLAIVGA